MNKYLFDISLNEWIICPYSLYIIVVFVLEPNSTEPKEDNEDSEGDSRREVCFS